jgi:hypothetical protein
MPRNLQEAEKQDIFPAGHREWNESPIAFCCIVATTPVSTAFALQMENGVTNSHTPLLCQRRSPLIVVFTDPRIPFISSYTSFIPYFLMRK